MLKLLKIPTAEQLYQQACDHPKPEFEPWTANVNGEVLSRHAAGT